MLPINVFQGVVIREPKLKQVADSVFTTLRLAADKAVAHHFDRNKYPLEAATGTFEQIFLEQFNRLKPPQQEAAKNQVLQRINADQTTRANLYGPQAVIDLGARLPVAEQATKLGLLRNLSFTSADLIQLQNRPPSGALIRGNAVPWSAVAPHVEMPRNLTAPGSALGPGPVPPGGLITPTNPAQLIDQKYQQLGGQGGFLGAPAGEAQTAPDKTGAYRHYQGGSIYWHPNTGAREVHGQIREKWKSLGWEAGFLGYPLTDESTTPDKKGRYNHFQSGSIYWTPETGAREVHGAIREAWKNLGWEKSVLGYPITDELGAPDGRGRYNHFQHGSIYWTPTTGAKEVHGAIRELWKSLGWERSHLGYPVTDELVMPDGKGRYNNFQGGSIRWYPDKGAYVASLPPVSKLALRIVKLHCLDETNWGPGELINDDEMAIGGSMIDAEANVTKINKTSLGNYNDGTWSNWPPKTLCELPLNQEDGAWPKTYIASLALVEVDEGGYTEFLNALVDKLAPFVKAKLHEVAIAKLGPALGLIAGEIAAYVVDKIFNLIKDIWNDDVFKPITVAMQIPGPGALFENGAYDSPDTWCQVKQHEGEYEYWVDWQVK